MPSPATNPQNTDSPHKSDSLTTGVAFVLAITVVQRGIGFVRTALFCRLLPEHELGQWSLALSFLMLCAPLTMLGITGSFGRYVEYYRCRSQLRMFLRRTAAAAALLGLTAACVLVVGREWISWAVFGTSEQVQLVWAITASLASAILYNFLLEVFVALRRPRVGSTMELIVSATFACLGLTSLAFDLGSLGLILSYTAGNVLGALYALLLFRPIWRELPDTTDPIPLVGLWSKLAPFAIGLWLINIISNLFDMVDRYMILHFSDMPAMVAQGMVGQYFSSLTFPLLMVAVSSLLAHLVLPYFSSDWETGNRTQVSTRLNLALKLLGMLLLTGSTCIILIGPIIFGVVFGNKYDAGFAVLPWTVTFCFWNGMVVMAYNYLYCNEKTRLSCISLLLGLTTNIVLNAVLLPRIGLLGAALATAAGSLLNLLLVYYFSVRLGMALDRRVLFVTVAPLVLCLGPHVAAIVLILFLAASVRTTLIFSVAERELVNEAMDSFGDKLLPRRARAVAG